MATLNHLEQLSKSFDNSSRMPVLFLGHGSPMNAIEDNEFVREFKALGERLDRPNAIVVVSAHWETTGTLVTVMNQPRTIHDFGGFPQALYDVQYPAPGHPELANDIAKMVEPENTIALDERWGLDHGSWTVVRHLFPKANVPVIQLSLDRTKPAKYHYELAQQLKKLRDKGVLVIGSGNIIHNLRRVAWDKLNENYAYDWALKASQDINKWILESNHQNLIDFRKHGAEFDLSIPTPEHYLPLLYSMALQDSKDDVSLFNDQPSGGSLTMTSVKISAN